MALPVIRQEVMDAVVFTAPVSSAAWVSAAVSAGVPFAAVTAVVAADASVSGYPGVRVTAAICRRAVIGIFFFRLVKSNLNRTALNHGSVGRTAVSDQHITSGIDGCIVRNAVSVNFKTFI